LGISYRLRLKSIHDQRISEMRPLHNSSVYEYS
jgi:hypothetical protein